MVREVLESEVVTEDPLVALEEILPLGFGPLGPVGLRAHVSAELPERLDPPGVFDLERDRADEIRGQVL